MGKIPGQRSNIALLISSFWTVLGLFILIVGHLVWVFFAYGIITNTDTLAELALFTPTLTKTHFYIVGFLAVCIDIWIMVSLKKQREHKIKR